jgi:hypothetical protein
MNRLDIVKGCKGIKQRFLRNAEHLTKLFKSGRLVLYDLNGSDVCVANVVKTQVTDLSHYFEKLNLVVGCRLSLISSLLNSAKHFAKTHQDHVNYVKTGLKGES